MTPAGGGAASSLEIANQTRREDTLQELFRVPYLPLDMQAAEAPGGWGGGGGRPAFVSSVERVKQR